MSHLHIRGNNLVLLFSFYNPNGKYATSTNMLAEIAFHTSTGGGGYEPDPWEPSPDPGFDSEFENISLQVYITGGPDWFEFEGFDNGIDVLVESFPEYLEIIIIPPEPIFPDPGLNYPCLYIVCDANNWSLSDEYRFTISDEGYFVISGIPGWLGCFKLYLSEDPDSNSAEIGEILTSGMSEIYIGGM